ncbi:MAG: hypothetical protein R3199_04415 [Gemmatimonadota bacterium]|nr:hypothetical protein [Gemmatimonadota bacterium]
MRPTRWIPATFAAAAALLLVTPSPAQVRTERNARPWLNPYAGVLAFDNGGIEDAGIEVDVAGTVGARIVVELGERWQVEAGYGFAPLTLEASEFVAFPESGLERDVNAHLFYATGGLFVGSEEVPTRLLLTAGAGGIALDPEEGESDTDFMVTLGAGFTHPVNDWILFRGDLRDHVLFCEAPPRGADPTSCVDEDTLHNIEVTGGLEFRLF